MRANFERIMPRILEHEGGYVNHPKDPGGATNKGVTQATYDAYRSGKGLDRRSVKLIASGEVMAIYAERYWAKVRGDDLPSGLDYATMDAAVNSGPARGAKWLQQAVGAAVDGRVGDATVMAANSVSSKVAAIKAMCGYRLSFVRRLRTWKTFGRGWMRRIAGVEAYAVRMALEAAGRPPASVDVVLEEEGLRQRKAKDAATGSATGLGGAGTAGAIVVPPDSGMPWWLIVGGVAILIIGLAILVWRARVHAARAEAYAAAAKGD